jgi:hypothetical protein
MKPFLLLGTVGCIILFSLQSKFGPLVEPIDIAEHTQWYERYAIRIPVLYHPETQKELGWPFDQTAVETFISLCGIEL